jgi:hypothetical protein
MRYDAALSSSAIESSTPPWKRLSVALARELAVFLAYLLGAIVFTFPLVENLDRAVKDTGDPLLDAWAIAWVAHQLPRDPLHLFDANRYHPETGTLAFTDPMLAISVPMAPVQWLFGNPVLTLNVAMLLTLALSGYGAFRLCAWLTNSRWAGAVGGSVFAFNAYRLSHLSHVNLQAMGFIPLALLCLSRYLEEGRARSLVGLGVFLWLVSASCAYYGVFTWSVVAVALPYEFLRTGALRRGARKKLLATTLAIVVSGISFLPLATPLFRLRQDFGFQRPVARVQRASARPVDYLRSSAHLHRAVGLEPPERGRSLFPGILALGLGCLGLLRLNKRLGLYVVIGVFAAWASLGPRYGLYRLLYELFPGFDGLRAPPRFSIFVSLALAGLAAAGAALLLSRISGVIRIALASVLVVLPLAESFAGPVPYAERPALPPVYSWLAQKPHPTPVVEVPIEGPLYKNAIYLYWSAFHFQPIANGHSTLVPPVFYQVRDALSPSPRETSAELLDSLGFRYVILHRDLYLRTRAAEVEAALEAVPGLEIAHRTDTETVFEVIGASRERSPQNGRR